jgi:general secretion pathway protein N
MKWLLSLILVLVIVPILLVFNIPASVLPRVLDEAYKRGLIIANAPTLEFEDLSGTLWDGKAGRAVLHIDGGDVPLGIMSWQVSTKALLDQHMHIDVQTQADNQQLSASIRATQQGEVTVRNAEGHFPLSVLEPWVPLLISADITFVFDRIVFTQQQLLAIDGMLNIEYVDWLGGDYPMPLGSYLAQVYLKGSDVEVKIDEFSGGLGVDGLISISPLGAYQFDATLTSRETLAPEVIETLAWFGRRKSNGQVLIRTNGRL